jgi:hypothetical protein
VARLALPELINGGALVAVLLDVERPFSRV